jgi:WD40 repeat protein
MEFLQKLLSTKNNKLIQKWRTSAHTSYIRCMDISYDGNLIVTSANDKLCIVRSIEDSTEIARFSKHTDHIHSLRFSYDSEKVISAGNGEIYIWDSKTGNEIAHITSHSSIGTYAAMDSKGHLVTTCSDFYGRIWIPENSFELSKLSKNTKAPAMSSIDISESGNVVVTTDHDHKVIIWRNHNTLGNWERSQEIIDFRGDRLQARITKNEDLIMVIRGGKPCSFYDIDSGNLVFELPEYTTNANSISISDNGIIVSTFSKQETNSKGNIWWTGETTRFGIWDFFSRKKLFEADAGIIITNAFITQDGQNVVLGLNNGEIAMWNVKI